MKILKTHDDRCIGCKLCMKVCAELYFKEDKSEKSCIQVGESPEGGFTTNVCNQCQTCVAECPPMALTVNRQGVVMLNKTLCIGCLACVAACPSHSLRTQADQVQPFKCIACGACAKECPADALEIETTEK